MLIIGAVAVGGGDDDVADRGLRVIAKVHERAGPGLVGVDLDVVQPRAVGMAEEIICGADGRIEMFQGECGRHGHNRTHRQPQRRRRLNHPNAL